MQKRVIAIVLMWSMVCASAWSMSSVKRYRATVLNSDCGLSQHDCECILQDKLGFVWIGTYDGLNRFDGKTVETFRHNPSRSNSINDNRITALAEWPGRDEIWIGTDGGLSYYNMRKGDFMTLSDYPDINDNFISCLLNDKDAMWVGTMSGLFKTSFDDADSVVVEQFPMFSGPQQVMPFVRALECDPDGNVYAATYYDMYIKTTGSSMFVKMMTFSSEIKQIYTDKLGQMWVITSRELYIFDPEKGVCSSPVTAVNIGDADSWCRILSVTNNMYLLLASRSLYWISVTNGEYIMEPVRFLDNDFWEDNVMKSMMIDNAMNIWITSAGDGVIRFDLNAKSIAHNGQPANGKTYVQKIFVDKRRRMWVATNNGVGVIESFDGGLVPVKNIPESVYDIYEDSEGIWISSTTHIYYLPEGNLNQVTEVRQMAECKDTGIFFSAPYAITGNGNGVVWIGMRNGILKIVRQNGHFIFSLNDVVSIQSIKAFNNITSLFFVDGGESGSSMFVGTKNMGLFRCGIAANGDLINPVAVRQSFPECGNHVWSITRAASGRIYVGTDCGVRELVVDSDGQRSLIKLCDDERINTYKIMSIVEDSKNNLWLNTSQGLLKYMVDRKETAVISASDGLSSNILCEGAWYNADSNLLYVGGIKGVDVLDLNSLQTNNIQPQTQITGIEINSTPIHTGEEFNGRVLLEETPEYADAISLRYYENNFSIEFASMHFSNPDKNTYLYKLEGFDNKWATVDNNTHSATFTNVPPGHYVFKVKSANCDGVLGADERCLIIDIDTPIYQSWAAVLVYILLGLGAVYAVYRYYTSRQSKKREALMQQMNHKAEMEIAEAKINYNTNITHELRTPLSLIMSPLDELLAKDYPDEFLDSRLKMIKTNADSLLQMISQFLDFRKVANAKMSLRIRRERLSELLAGIVNSFSVTAEQKGIVLEFCNDLPLDVYWCDRDVIRKICSNLLINAIKYSPEDSHVILHAVITPDKQVQISVEDNGIGISEEDCEKIFERFYQVPGTIGGTGIGLNLCKSLALLHKGTISVVSHKGEGSIFTFTFPSSKDVYSDDIVEYEHPVVLPVRVNNTPSDDDAGTEPDVAAVVEKKMVLIIEDNAELRNYVVQILQPEFKVISAGNGQEGLTMTVDHIPDIVVCDIMMPVMDGIEYTRKVRQDIRTSHIPIILLTAKVAAESEIEGLSYGADDYVMKPFNPQVLKLRIENLLRLTSAKARTVSKGAPADNDGGETLNDRERNFVDTLRQLVIDNMSVPGYGMDDICSEMGMSRMQLHRKITAILNKKPSQFIKEVKMTRAYTLLKEKGLNITETMYEVGYSNYSYFSKLFVEVHGVSPRELLGMRTKGNGKRQ